MRAVRIAREFLIPVRLGGDKIGKILLVVGLRLGPLGPALPQLRGAILDLDIGLIDQRGRADEGRLANLAALHLQQGDVKNVAVDDNLVFLALVDAISLARGLDEAFRLVLVIRFGRRNDPCRAFLLIAVGNLALARP